MNKNIEFTITTTSTNTDVFTYNTYYKTWEVAYSNKIESTDYNNPWPYNSINEIPSNIKECRLCGRDCKCEE